MTEELWFFLGWLIGAICILAAFHVLYGRHK
jgi:hypothetical protein